MRFLALEKPGTCPPVLDAAEHAALLRAEARATWNLHLAGVLRDAWLRADRHDAILMLECADAAAAEAAVAALPLVRAGVIGFEVIGLRPYDGWARLFREDD